MLARGPESKAPTHYQSHQHRDAPPCGLGQDKPWAGRWEAWVLAQVLVLADWVSLGISLHFSGLGIFIYKLKIMIAILPALFSVLERLCMQVFDGN